MRVSFHRLITTGLLTLASSVATWGFVAGENKWPNGNVHYQIRLGGSASGSLIDGSTSWNTVAQSAFDEWNQHLQDVQFTGEEAAVGGQGETNRVNDLFFSSTIYGDAFGGSTLAVTLNLFSGFEQPLPRVEADIVFNNKPELNWNSYRGSRRFDVDDLRRVLIHELGHALGLDHPDQFGQSVSAIMNAFVSDIDTVVADDIAGGQSLYGARSTGGGGGGGGGSGGGGGGGSSGTAKLANLAVRAQTSNTTPLILGFAITNASKEMLIRGVGPTLIGFGVPTAIADPTMRMFSGADVIDSNDDWVNASNSSQMTSLGDALGAFEVQSTLESILLRQINSGPYTVQVTDFDGRSGEVLIEAYDAEPLSATGRLSNLSTRTRVGGSAGILTAGFVIVGEGQMQLLVRGVGPTLGRFGVSAFIPDPRIQVLDSDQNIVASNDDWNSSDSAAKRAVASDVGAFALNEDSFDAALLVTLSPGAYTVQVLGVNGSQGEAVVEIYEVR